MIHNILTHPGGAHKIGFMCKTSATEPKRLQELVAAAWSSEPRSG